MITLAQIRDAQNNDLDAIAALLAEMDQRIARLAAQAARRIEGGHREDFEQDAREAMFMALPRVDVTRTADSAIGFLYQSMSDALKDKVRAERYQGADKDAVKVFMSVLDSENPNPYVAERLAQTVPAKGLRLSADRAAAARLAWQGAVSIDRPSGDDEDSATLADTLAAPHAEPEAIRPKVGTGAALEALSVLQRYSSARSVLRSLPVGTEDVDAIEDTVTLPREAFARRAVLDAVAILRSYVSTAKDGDLAADLRTEGDDRRDERAAKTADVRAVVESLSAQQSEALRLTFGLDGRECYGNGDGSDVDGFAEALGTTVSSARKTRSVALKSFAERWIARVAKTLDEAQAWAAAASDTRKRGGRK